MPEISVLVAAHQAAANIGQALQSVCEQSFKDWECVVVDDGSTDHTVEIVEDFVARDARFHLLRQEHSGVVTARNLGIELCCGRYISIFDADDSMHPLRLGTQCLALDQMPAVDAIGCHVRYEPREDCGEGRLQYEAWLNQQFTAEDIRRDCFIEMPVGHPTLMFRANVLRKLQYRDMGWPEDWDLLLRTLHQGHEIGMCPEVMHQWNLSTSSLSAVHESYTTQAFLKCRAHFLAHSFLKEESEYSLIGYGNTGKALRKAMRKHGKTCTKIYELHPDRIGQNIEGAAVVHQKDIAQVNAQGIAQKILVSVAGADARKKIREVLAAKQYRDGDHFVCTA